MIFLLTCRANEWKWQRIRNMWLDHCAFSLEDFAKPEAQRGPPELPYVFAVGDATIERGTAKFDPITRVLSIGCEDNYDELPHKIAFGIRAIMDGVCGAVPNFIMKIDDDVLVHPFEFHRYIERAQRRQAQYEGYYVETEGVSHWGIDKFQKPKNKTPVVLSPVKYCGGPMYYLGPRALAVLAQNMDPDRIKFEDVLVGQTLQNANITPVAANIYSDSYDAAMSGKYVAWHDGKHESVMNKK